MNRIIGSFDGQIEGPLVLVFGALHGNEPAGVRALEAVFQLLKSKKEIGFHGKLVGMLGNRQAFLTGQRFLKKDFNRLWTSGNLQRIRHIPEAELEAEDLEMAEIFSTIHTEIQEVKPRSLILLDLHTTSADGGIFSIPSDDVTSLDLAKKLQAPVILDLFEGVEGTLLRFAADGHFQIGGHPKNTVGVAFEAGRHDDPLSVSRSLSAIIACLEAVGCMPVGKLENPHNAVWKEENASLPKVTRLRHVHHIRPGDAFRMRPGYRNFQPIREGEHLADDATGPILAPYNGLILMPLYQPKGSDGFFIIQEV